MIVNSILGIRNYQIIDKSDRADGKDTHLIEIGPRMVLIPIRIFSGTFAGATLYQNMAFVSPNQERSALRKLKGWIEITILSALIIMLNSDEYNKRVRDNIRRKEQLIIYKPPVDELAGNRIFKET